MYTVTSLKHSYDTAAELLIALLKAKGCWSRNHPKSAQEISVKFNLPLETAQKILLFFNEKV